ncbi:MAG: dihydroorotase, partial [Sulfurimonadaceae bacterium]|nr:dihydroorotase [Sulfurimonadaceae bacterium]
MKTHTLLMPLDMHLHLRDGVMLETVAPLTSYTFSGAIIMPNLVPPVMTKEAVVAYRERINMAIGYNPDEPEMGNNDYFEPFMTLFYQNYDREFLEDVQDEITAIKLYPAG